MSGIKSFKIGTRGSRLALAQTQLVADALKQHAAKLKLGVTIETKIITTKGDTNQSPIPLDTVGKAWFTGEIEQALLAGEIDLAVHSLKDMTPETTPGLVTVIVLERGDPRDVLIAKQDGKVSEQSTPASGMRLKDLPHGAIIGTDSIRRKVLLLDQRPDLIVKSIRGNVDTRLKKLNGEGEFAGVNTVSVAVEKYDAIVLAAAGLERLGMLDVVSEFFDPAIFSIAPGQGVLAAQTRADQAEVLSLLRGIEHTPTRIAAEAELAFSHAIGGGCKLPIGCYAKIEGDTITIHGMMGGDDHGESGAAAKVTRKSVVGPIDQAVALATALAREFL